MKNPAEVAHGPMFIGFTFNVFLYGIMVTQAYLYFTTYKQDRTWMKSFVVLLLVADTVNTVFDFAYLYRSLIVHFGDGEFLATADWIFATEPATTGIIASLVQCFFAWRICILTNSWPLSGIVVAGAMIGGISAVATAFEVGRTPHFVDFRDFKAVVIAWLAAESITDVAITAIMVWFLRKHKTGFQESDLMVDRIIRITMQTGLITSLVAILDLIFFLTNPSGIHLIFNFPLSKLYTNSLMSSLNSRRGWKFGSSNQDFSVVQSSDLGMLTTSNLTHSPPLSPHSPPSSPHALRNSRVSFDSGGISPHARNSNPAFRSTNDAVTGSNMMQSKRNARPEVFVEIESGQSTDDIEEIAKLTYCRGQNIRTAPTRQALTACLSIGTSLNHFETPPEEQRAETKQIAKGGFGESSPSSKVLHK
ncbi:hypothetical protein B0H34DRAFT_859227 [Crassisporium funariophilum]|nr:hypothetical protein B0H34DRAFT_859227 [Crassisporium funariophilum]